MNSLIKYIKLILKSPYTLLLFFAIIAYWQIAFLTNSIQWDMLDCHLPWRYFVSETIQNGEFPLWNPYQQLGYPIHADLRTIWNPVVLLVGLFGIYTNYTLHFFLILYLFLAGSGMYRLMMHFNSNKEIALIIGIVYMLSGFFISHAQEISSFAGAAFIPFIILYYLKFFNRFKYIEIIKVSVLLFLMISTAYPAFTIILAYLLITIFLFCFIAIVVRKKYKLLKRTIIAHSMMIIIMGLLSSVFIVTLLQVNPYVSRIGGLTAEKSMLGAFTPQSIISFLLPFASVKNAELFKTDITMTNAYFGVIIFILFVSSLFKRKTLFEYLLLGFGIITLFASFGEYTPVREFLYNYLPLLDKFRFPSFFTLFTIIIFLILTGNFLAKTYKNEKYYYKPILYIAFSTLLILIYAIVYSKINFSFNDFTFFNKELTFWEMLKKSTYYEHIFIQGIIQFIVVAVFIYFLIKNRSIKKVLVYLILVEMIIAVQFNMYYTGISEAKPKNIHSYIDNCPKGFYIPENNLISENTDKESSFWPLWRNTSIFTKKVSFDSFNSFFLKGYETLLDSFPELKNAMLKNELLYLSDRILPYSSINKTSIRNNDIYVHDTVYNKTHKLELETNRVDKIEIIKFSSTGVIANTNTKETQIITFLQSNYYGWEVFIDDNPVPYFTSNFLVLSTILPKGKHKIEYRYKNNNVITGFVISYLTFGILLIILALYYTVRLKKHKGITLFFLSLIILILVYKIIYISVKEIKVQSFNKPIVYSNMNDFETQYQYWKTDTSFINNLKFYSENKSYIIDSLSEYCCVFESKCQNLIKEYNVDILVNVKVLFENNVNSTLVLSVDRGEESILWEGSTINDSLYSKNIWHEIRINANDIKLQKDDIIKTYIWNKNKNQFYIDDFEILFLSK